MHDLNRMHMLCRTQLGTVWSAAPQLEDHSTHAALQSHQPRIHNWHVEHAHTTLNTQGACSHPVRQHHVVWLEATHVKQSTWLPGRLCTCQHAASPLQHTRNHQASLTLQSVESLSRNLLDLPQWLQLPQLGRRCLRRRRGLAAVALAR